MIAVKAAEDRMNIQIMGVAMMVLFASSMAKKFIPKKDCGSQRSANCHIPAIAQ